LTSPLYQSSEKTATKVDDLCHAVYRDIKRSFAPISQRQQGGLRGSMNLAKSRFTTFTVCIEIDTFIPNSFLQQ